jgi:hypothetical protein
MDGVCCCQFSSFVSQALLTPKYTNIVFTAMHAMHDGGADPDGLSNMAPCQQTCGYRSPSCKVLNITTLLYGVTGESFTWLLLGS